MPPARKFCARCNTRKPVAEFWKNRRRRDGLQDYCKPCLSELQRPADPLEKVRRAEARAARRLEVAEADAERAARKAGALEARRLRDLEAEDRRRALEDARARRRALASSPKAPTPPAGFRRCARCGTDRPLEAFPPSPLYPRERSRQCSTCLPIVRPGIAFAGPRGENP